MAKRQQNFSSDQGDLFQRLDEPTLGEGREALDLDVAPELLGAVNTAIRQARQNGLSRERIVDRMNAALPDLDKEITLRQLNSWTAKSREYHEFPARYIPAFCQATSCSLPLKALTHSLGFDLADLRDQAALRLGENLITSAQLSRERRELTQTLGGK